MFIRAREMLKRRDPKCEDDVDEDRSERRSPP
jgi:hypothetical protein